VTTSTMPVTDHLLFEMAGSDLLDAIRTIGHGGIPAAPASAVLGNMRLVTDTGELTDAGRRIFVTAWVRTDEKQALIELGEALRMLLPVQVLEQELRGFGPTPEHGALDLLKFYRAAPVELRIDAARSTFRWLNGTGVLAYDRKNKTVRSIAPSPDAALPGEDRSLAAMISPDTRFSNTVRLRRIIRTLRGTVWWIDPHFSARAFEELVIELDPDAVTELRILSGDDTSVLTSRSFKDLNALAAEMAGRGIAVEWRVDAARDWHDRWLLDDDTDNGFNMPPVNTLFQGNYSEMLPTNTRPPIHRWWDRSTIRTS